MLFYFLFESDLTAELIKALDGLISSLTDKFGTERVFWTIVIVCIVTALWKLWVINKKDKDIDMALSEKDRTIQRLSSENREHRVLIAKEVFKWSDEEIDRFILKNTPENADEARSLLEKSLQTVKKVFTSNSSSEEDEGDTK